MNNRRKSFPRIVASGRPTHPAAQQMVGHILRFAGIAVALMGCGGAVHEPRIAPSARAVPATATVMMPATDAPIWTLPTEPRDPNTAAPTPKDVRTEAWSKAAKVKAVPAAPPSCAPFANPSASVYAQSPVGAMLATLEVAKPELAPAIRAMRADLAPVECADTMTDPALSATPVVSGAAGQMSIGLSLASKLSRTAASAPAMKDASDKEKVKRFIQGPLRQWMVEQASAIDTLSAPAIELSGVARGIVAIEAGMADLRLVDRIRSSPTPSTWDKELRAIYEAALDEALEPRKTRGRDAALVGLADFAAAGIVQDARVDRARALLSKLYGGRRIDALDALLLPPLDDAKRSTLPESELALVPDDVFAQIGLAAPAPAATRTEARVRLERGRKYWRRVDFVEAAHAASKEATPDSRLILAVALVLAKGPNGAKAMMTAPSPAALGLKDTEALDALTREAPARIAGMAAFDAAHLRSLSTPEGDAAGPYLFDVAVRFRKAAALLTDPEQKKRAEERAADAEAAARAASR